jgi:hypothetical protein
VEVGREASGMRVLEVAVLEVATVVAVTVAVMVVVETLEVATVGLVGVVITRKSTTALAVPVEPASQPQVQPLPSSSFLIVC